MTDNRSTELILVRHGEAHCNTAGILGGPRGCTGLTPRGHIQAALIAARLKAEATAGAAIDTLYASPIRRCQETAETVARELDMHPTIVNSLRAPDHGEADGLPYQVVTDAIGGPAPFSPTRTYANGSESWKTYLDRTAAALQAIIKRHKRQRVAVVCHAETFDAAAYSFMNIPLPELGRYWLTTDHTAVTRWRHHHPRYPTAPPAGLWVLNAHNDTRHLAEFE